MKKGCIVRVKRAATAQLKEMPGAGVIVATTVDKHHIVQARVAALTSDTKGQTILFNMSALEPFRGALTVESGKVVALEDFDDRDTVDAPPASIWGFAADAIPWGSNLKAKEVRHD